MGYKTLFTILSFIICLILNPTIVQNKTASDINFDKVERFIEVKENINEYVKFKEHLAFKESSNRYHVTSGNYWGKYQLGKFARRDVEIRLSRISFINDKSVQEIAFFDLLKTNKNYLKEDIDEYVGKTINGIKITKSGILASAHLVGYYSVKNYLHSNGKNIKFDGNGTSLEEYMIGFSGYNFKIDSTISNYIKDTY